MADSGNPEDLVSQVTVTGTEESLAKLDAYATGGAAAFEKLNVASKASAAGVASASATIDTASKVATAAVAGIGAGGLAAGLSNLPNTFKAVGVAVKDLTDKFQPLTQAIGRFSQRIALAGTGAVAAGLGLAKTAAGIAKASDSQTTATDQLTAAQQKNIDSTLKSDERSINHGHSVRELNNQLIAGKLSYSEYGKALVELDDQERESIRVQNQMEAAQERAKEATDKLNKSVKDREAFTKLVDTLGGPLTQSMISFGRQIETIHKSFLDAFGPAAAQGIDLISQVLTKNATAINAFFSEAGTKISSFLTANGPAIQKLIENIGAGVSKVFLGIIDAAPGVIDFFNNVLVPAIQKVASAFNLIADAINYVFGTRLTGGSIVLIAILAQITGSIKLVFVLLKSFGAIFSGLIGVIEAIGVGLAEAFGLKKVADIIRMGAAVSKGKGIFATLGAAIRIIIPLITLLATTIAEGLGIALGPVYIAILLVAAALIYLATKVDWKKFGAGVVQFGKDAVKWFGDVVKAGGQLVSDLVSKFVQFNNYLNSIGASIGQAFASGWAAIKQAGADAAQWVMDKWNAVGDWFASAGDTIGKGLSSAWDSIKQAGADAAQWIQDKWQSLTAWFAGVGALITQGISTAWETIKQLGADAAQWVLDKWNAVLTWFKGLPDQLAGLWDTIKTAIVTAFQTAIDTVKGFFADLLAKAKAYLQPIIDLLNAIASLTSSTDTSGGGGPPGFAAGGKIRGPGGPTADKIPIWASNGEYMVKAASVAKYGTGLLHAINSGNFQMPGFAAGGLIGISRQGYADGGEVKPQTLRPLSLSIFGEQFDGLLAPEDVGERMGKYAVSRQNKSAGRKPAWVGRGK